MKQLFLSLMLISFVGVVKGQDLQFFEGENGKLGLKNSKGILVVEAKYDYAESFSDGMAVVNIGSEWLDDPFVPWPEGGKWGYINEQGEEVIALQYDATRSFSEGRGIYIVKVADRDFRYGYLDNQGEIITPPEFAFAFDFKNDYAKVYDKDDLVTMISKDGKKIFPFKYDMVNYHLDNRFSLGVKDPKGVENQYLYALADANGKLLSEMKYSYIGDFKEGLVKASIGHGAEALLGYLNLEGKEVIPVIYQSLETYPTKDGYRMAKRNGKWGLIDQNNKEIIPFIYQNLTTYDYYEGRVWVKKDDKQGVIDLNNKVLLPIKYDGISILYKDLSILGVKIDGKWGLMDYKGNILVEPQFDVLMSPSLKDNDKAIARVSLNRKYFHIDRNGNIVE